MSVDKQQSSRPEAKPCYPGVAPRSPSEKMAIDEVLTDIQGTFGFVPDFINLMTETYIPGVWNEIKNVYFNPNTALPLKLKSLISLAVSSQTPCDFTCYFNHAMSVSSGATHREQIEAVTMAAITRHWSTILNGSQIDRNAFHNEADQIMSHVTEMMKKSGGKPPAEETFLVKYTSAAETYKDIEKTLGLIPTFFLLFPEEGVSGAWSEFKGVQLNPYTALSGRDKELISLAVAAQIPCDYCIYFHRSASKLHGANSREMQESLALSALSRHWSTLFHGMQMGLDDFKRDTDRMVMRSSGRRM